ncbi:MAG: TraR/DksA C4-type zinc finger protein [Planctomycetota bacterium]
MLGPGSPIRKPLIPSGPAASEPDDGNGLTEAKGKRKSPFKKRELDRFRSILRIKRAQLIGDVSQMEAEALLGDAGDSSSLPQHLAEQGSDSYERSLSLDLAAQDRKMIKEIDDAIQRIEDGVYGVCEHTGNPIRKERLEELPWARYSIEAARALERSSMPG